MDRQLAQEAGPFSHNTYDHGWQIRKICLLVFARSSLGIDKFDVKIYQVPSQSSQIDRNPA